MSVWVLLICIVAALAATGFYLLYKQGKEA